MARVLPGARRRRSGARAPMLIAAAAFALVLSSGGCAGRPLLEGERLGAEGMVAFGTETDVAFTARLVVGSRFRVTFRAIDEEESGPLLGATLESSDPEVLVVEDANVTVVGGGTADLIVTRGGQPVDRIALTAAPAAATVLASGSLLSATTTVDVRLPVSFALLPDVETNLLVAAVDRCGGDLLDLHASTLEVADAEMTVDATQPASFAVTSPDAGEASLTLKTPGLADLTFRVKTVAPADVDEVEVAASSASGVTVTMFGRAFVDDAEVVSPLSFSWSSDERVVLEQTEGLAVRANVSVPAEGEPPDERPAVVTAEVFGVSGSLDLLTATPVTALGAPARVFEIDEGTVSGCSGEPCDPAAAAFALFGLRASRRLRRGVARLMDARARLLPR